MSTSVSRQGHKSTAHPLRSFLWKVVTSVAGVAFALCTLVVRLFLELLTMLFVGTGVIAILVLVGLLLSVFFGKAVAMGIMVIGTLIVLRMTCTTYSNYY